jgi:hypothetical protein
LAAGGGSLGFAAGGGSTVGLAAAGGSTVGLGAGGSTGGLGAGGSTAGLAGGGSTVGLVAAGGSTAGLAAGAAFGASAPGLGCVTGGTQAPPANSRARLEGLAGRDAAERAGSAGGLGLGAFGGGAAFDTPAGGTHGPPIGRGVGFLASWMSFLTSASTSASSGTERALAGDGLGLPPVSGAPQALHAVSQSPLCQLHLLQTITSLVR